MYRETFAHTPVTCGAGIDFDSKITWVLDPFQLIQPGLALEGFLSNLMLVSAWYRYPRDSNR
jgi:hypothetical protein